VFSNNYISNNYISYIINNSALFFILISKSHGPLRNHLIGYFYYFVQIWNRNLINWSVQASHGIIKQHFFQKQNLLYFLVQLKNIKDAVQSDLRMCTKKPSFYLQTVYCCRAQRGSTLFLTCGDFSRVHSTQSLARSMYCRDLDLCLSVKMISGRNN
jgi:uncharacterized membrane protein